MNRTVAGLAESYGFTLDPTAVVRDLSVGEQQRVEILKALYRRCQFLILDEPTAVLTPNDTEKLFDSLRDLQQKHLSVEAERGHGDQPAGDGAAARQGCWP
jgi:simple sugar transport system ATP-binding protein